jgi:hypothetical protein
VAEIYETVKINFGKEEGEEWTLGEVEQMRPSGRRYGFNTDHTDMVETFSYLRPNKGFVEETNIRLKEDGAFEYGTGNGTFLVKVTIGPVDGNYDDCRHHCRWKYHNKWMWWCKKKEMKAYVEGSGIVVQVHEWKRIREYEVLVSVEDGKLSIGGDEGLPIMNLEVRKLTQEEAAAYSRRPPDDKGPPGRWKCDEEEDKKWDKSSKGGWK